MHTDTTPKEKPTGSANSTAGDTDDQIVPNVAGADKTFSSLCVQVAIRGHALRRTNPFDGQFSYYAARWGLVRHLPTLDDVRRFLMQIGGRHG